MDNKLIFEMYDELMNQKETVTHLNFYECSSCGSDIILSDYMKICQNCGISEEYLIAPSDVQYKKFYFYKRIDHFKKWIRVLTDQTVIRIPDETVRSIQKHIKSNKLEITYDTIKHSLKHLNMQNKYFYSYQIYFRLKNMPPPQLSQSSINKLIELFGQFEIKFKLLFPNKHNFLRFHYLLIKLCLLTNNENFVQYIPQIKSKSKLKSYDKIFDMVWNS